MLLISISINEKMPALKLIKARDRFIQRLIREVFFIKIKNRDITAKLDKRELIDMVNFFFYDLVNHLGLCHVNALINAYSIHNIKGDDKGLITRAKDKAVNLNILKPIRLFCGRLLQAEKNRVSRISVLGALDQQVLNLQLLDQYKELKS